MITFYKNKDTNQVIKVSGEDPQTPLGYVRIDSSEFRKIKAQKDNESGEPLKKFLKNKALVDSIFDKLEGILVENGFTQEEIKVISKFKKRLI